MKISPKVREEREVRDMKALAFEEIDKAEEAMDSSFSEKLELLAIEKAEEACRNVGLPWENVCTSQLSMNLVLRYRHEVQNLCEELLYEAA